MATPTSLYDMDRDTRLSKNMTLGEALDMLPEPNLDGFFNGEAEKAIQQNHGLIMGMLYIRALLGEQTASTMVGKLNMERYMAKTKVAMLMNAGAKRRAGEVEQLGAAAAMISGPSDDVMNVLRDVLRNGTFLPKDDNKAGLETLREVHSGE